MAIRLPLFANRTVTDCRATASVAREAKRLPHKSSQNARLLCAFFKRGGLTTQVSQNLASEMKRAGNPNWI